MDTRTPRSPSGGRSPGFDEDVLSTLRVPSDPAQVIVNNASFRVKLGASAPRPRHGVEQTAAMPVVPTSVRSAAEARTGRRRAAPLVWSGRTEPGDPGATPLLQAVRGAAATQLLPRVSEDPHAVEADTEGLPVRPAVVAPRSPLGGATAPGRRPPRVGRPAGPPPGDTREERYPGLAGGRHGADPGGYPDGPAYDTGGRHGEDPAGATAAERRRYERRRGDPVRHAWYPGRRINLGVVLLPLRVFLGLISVYAGLGKLCDPVYFDGGVRGSMVHWLASLHPWSVAEPLRAAALGHPVGAGLTVAFAQVVVGVLTVLGLWQRAAAAVGALLSAALLVTVSWRTVPVYDAPDIIYLAAWSPLAIAGAPAYSIDSRLAGEAWRRLGARAPLWQLRRYVVRRGLVLATLVAGGSLIVGAAFGSAVRASSSHVRSPATPSDLPTNDLPGSPYPQPPISGLPGPHGRHRPGGPGPVPPSAGVGSSAAPSPSAPTGHGRTAGRAGLPGRTTGQAPRPPSSPQHGGSSNSAPSSGGSSSGPSGSLGGLLGGKPSSGFLLGMHGSGHHRPTDPDGQGPRMA